MKGSAQQQKLFFKISRYAAVSMLLWCFNIQSSLAADATASIASAEASFRYIASTLRTFRDSGRLVNNPGIDGADLEEFFRFLSEFYAQFSRDFGADSAMCVFYTDPENSRMTIEERAEIGFSFLRDVDDRLARYLAVDRDFQETIEREFGSILLANINAIKAELISNQRLPTSNFDEAAKINFADTACY